MATTILLHLTDESPIVGEIEHLPSAEDLYLGVSNPRAKDGKDLSMIDPDVVMVYWPIHGITYLELLPSADEEPLMSFIRE